MGTLPVIDISGFRAGDPDQSRRVAAAVHAACIETGFFLITGHGVPEALIASLRATLMDFFRLPLEEKVRVEWQKERSNRGYARLADRALAYSLQQETPPDLQESYGMGPLDPAPRPVQPGDPMYPFFAPNFWPERPAALAGLATDYYRAMERLSATVLAIFARALGMPDDFFDDKIDRHTSAVRFLLYPAQPTPPLPGQLRAGEHTDYGTVTILHIDDAPGKLQVRTRGGQWVDVEPVPNGFVCNIGDLMARWTNDRWTSNLHRVANPPPGVADTDRLSLVYFQNPNYDTEVRCIESCADLSHPVKYPPVSFGDYYLGKQNRANQMILEAPAIAG